jgi:hypothetical protein
VGKSASQMCLSFAAPGESNRAHSFASKHRATVLVQHSGKSLAAFYPQPEIPDGLTLSEEVESDGRVEEKRPHEVLGARVGIYMAAKKWDMPAAVASHPAKIQPENETWRINGPR